MNYYNIFEFPKHILKYINIINANICFINIHPMIPIVFLNSITIFLFFIIILSAFISIRLVYLSLLSLKLQLFFIFLSFISSFLSVVFLLISSHYHLTLKLKKIYPEINMSLFVLLTPSLFI